MDTVTKVTGADTTLAPVVDALHGAYAALSEHVEKTHGRALPPVTIIVKRDRRAWGHITVAPAWIAKNGDAVREIMVSGENLARGARDVFGTLAHEATHAYNLAVGVRDTDVNGRHNTRFRDAARDLFGLTITEYAPNHWAGWTKTDVGDECAAQWAAVIDAIGAAIIATAPRHDTTTGGGATGGTGGGIVLPPMPKGRDKNLTKATCGCGSIIRTSAKALAKGITCGGCGEGFRAAK